MRRIPDALLAQMQDLVSAEDRDEMAIPSYRHPNPALRWMAWRRVEVLAQALERRLEGPADETTVVDYGCGTGVLFESASRRASRVIGVDLVTEPAERWVAELGLGNVEIMEPDSAESRIAAASVDVLVAGEVLEHIEPLAPTLARFRRWLGSDGTMLVSLPTESALYRFGRRLAGFSGHYHHAGAASIHREILEAGFVRRGIRKVPLPGPFAIYWVIEYGH